MHMYFSFLSFILHPLNEFNTIFQADEAKIGYLKEEMCTLLRKFMGKFVKAKVIQSTEDLTAVPFEDSNSQLNDNIIAIGMMTRAYMVDHEDDIQPASLQRFFMSVRKFYHAVTSKMLAKFPFKDVVVSHLTFLNPASRGELPPTTLTELAKRFPSLVPQDQWEQLEEEFRDYQTTPAVELPSFLEDTRADVYWGRILNLRNKITNTLRFPVMGKIARAMLSVPNSNAECERVFSMVKKIQTETRSNLDNKTVCALLTTKINNIMQCNQMKPSKELLSSAKKACVMYNTVLK